MCCVSCGLGIKSFQEGVKKTYLSRFLAWQDEAPPNEIGYRRGSRPGATSFFVWLLKDEEWDIQKSMFSMFNIGPHRIDPDGSIKVVATVGGITDFFPIYSETKNGIICIHCRREDKKR